MKPVLFLYGRESDRIKFINEAKNNGLKIVNYRSSFDHDETIRVTDLSKEELFYYFAGMINSFQQKQGDVLLLHDCPVDVVGRLTDTFCFPIHTIYVGKPIISDEYDKVICTENNFDKEIRHILNTITQN